MIKKTRRHNEVVLNARILLEMRANESKKKFMGIEYELKTKGSAKIY